MRLALIILSIFFCSAIHAQQLPQYTNFVNNYLMMNPAVAGSATCLELKLGYRTQWHGFEGNPRTAYANIHGNFGKKKHNFHGVGGIVETDDTGPLSYTSIHLVYAYHMKVSRKSYLSAGLAAGFLQYRIDRGGMTLTDPDDPILISGAAFMYPQINFGLWLYNEDRFFGFAIRQVPANSIPSSDQGKMRSHFSFSAGKMIEMNDEFRFKPAGQIKYVAKSKLAVDAQAMIAYKEKVALGLGFRGGNGLAALIKIDMFKYITLAYSYDLTLSKIRYGGINTHEITIGVQACPNGEGHGIPCAAYD